MQSKKRLWLTWVIITGIGWPIAELIGEFVKALFIPTDTPPDIGSLFISGIASGATLGVLQWLVLRQRIKRASFWILASALGIGMFQVVSYLLEAQRGFVLDRSKLILNGILLGAFLGIFQGMLISRYHLLAIVWVLGSTIAWTVGMSALCNCALIQFMTEQMMAYQVWVLIPGTIAGIITGFIIVWLVQHSSKRSDSATREQTISNGSGA